MNGVRILGFGPGGNEVVALLKDGRSRAWPVDILEAALEKKPRELTVQERKKYGLLSETEEAAYLLVQRLFDEWFTNEKVLVRIEGMKPWRMGSGKPPFGSPGCRRTIPIF